MKQFLILLSLTILSNSFLTQKMSIEPNIGINIMPLPQNGIGTDHKIAFSGGINGQYNINESLSIQLGLGISNRRQQYHYTDTISILEQYREILQIAGVSVDEIDSTLQANGLYLNQIDRTYGIANLAHLEIPITIGYQWNSIQFKAGGYFGFRIGAQKKEEVTSDVPLLQIIDISQYDTTGLISTFLPPAHNVTTSDVSNTDYLDKLVYGLRFSIGYAYDSNLSFSASYNLDLNNYAIEENNEITNNKYFIRIGMAYNIYNLKVNSKNTKPKFE